MDFEQSRTFANLMSAYAGESQARVKYNIYAKQARTEGYEQLGNIFDETSHNEFAHATMWLKYIKGGAFKPTTENLKDAKNGEHFEWSEMYKGFAEEADTEGYKEIAAAFRMVAKVEALHEQRYQTLLDTLQAGKIFKKDSPKQWICLNCGHVHEGAEAPGICPVCKYPQAYFEERCQNY